MEPWRLILISGSLAIILEHVLRKIYEENFVEVVE